MHALTMTERNNNFLRTLHSTLLRKNSGRSHNSSIEIYDASPLTIESSTQPTNYQCDRAPFVSEIIRYVDFEEFANPDCDVDEHLGSSQISGAGDGLSLSSNGTVMCDIYPGQAGDAGESVARLSPWWRHRPGQPGQTNTIMDASWLTSDRSETLVSELSSVDSMAAANSTVGDTSTRTAVEISTVSPNKSSTGDMFHYVVENTIVTGTEPASPAPIFVSGSEPVCKRGTSSDTDSFVSALGTDRPRHTSAQVSPLLTSLNELSLDNACQQRTSTGERSHLGSTESQSQRNAMDFFAARKPSLMCGSALINNHNVFPNTDASSWNSSSGMLSCIDTTSCQTRLGVSESIFDASYVSPIVSQIATMSCSVSPDTTHVTYSGHSGCQNKNHIADANPFSRQVKPGVYGITATNTPFTYCHPETTHTKTQTTPDIHLSIPRNTQATRGVSKIAPKITRDTLYKTTSKTTLNHPINCEMMSKAAHMGQTTPSTTQTTSSVHSATPTTAKITPTSRRTPITPKSTPKTSRCSPAKSKTTPKTSEGTPTSQCAPTSKDTPLTSKVTQVVTTVIDTTPKGTSIQLGPKIVHDTLHDGQTTLTVSESVMAFADWSQEQLESLAPLEVELCAEFATSLSPTRDGELRRRGCFNYLLLDPALSCRVPSTTADGRALVAFAAAVFYVGKGQQQRSYCHLLEALNECDGRDAAASAKVRRIRQIWRAGGGVVPVHVFQHRRAAEALARESLMLTVLDRERLTNVRSGVSLRRLTGPAGSVARVRRWTPGQLRRLGVWLVYKAMRHYQLEGEVQLRPEDVACSSTGGFTGFTTLR